MPTRELLFNASALGVVMLYLLMALPFGVLAYGLARRVRQWREGQPEDRFERMGTRIAHALRMSVLHGRIVRRRNLYGGIMHAGIFFGFITLFAGTLIVMVENDIARPLFGASFFHGGFYLGFKLVMNRSEEHTSELQSH